jgi:hypothetical protein
VRKQKSSIKVIKSRGYNVCGYSLPAGRECSRMKCLYKYCGIHMSMVDKTNTSNTEYPNPYSIMVKYFDINQQELGENDDLTNANRRIYVNATYM